MDKWKKAFERYPEDWHRDIDGDGYDTNERERYAYITGINDALEDKFEAPKTPIKESVEVTSRMKYIDDDLKPIAEFILEYASWNLHKEEWNKPVAEVPLFRVLDALVQRGKPYCESN